MNHVFDWISLLTVLALGAVGYKRGFLEELGRLIGLIVSSIAAMAYHSNLSHWLNAYVPLDAGMVSVLSFAVVFFTYLFAIRLLTKMLQVLMVSKGIRWTNRLLGFLFGGLKGSVLILVVLWMVDTYPSRETFANLKEQSRVYRSFSSYGQRIAKSFGIEEQMIHSQQWIREKLRVEDNTAE